MEIPEGHFRHTIFCFFYFRRGKNPAQAHRKLCGVYGDECLSERQCQNWFARFRSGNLDVKDEPRPGQTINSTLYSQQLMRLKQAIKKKRPELINRKCDVFHQDNARPQISLVTRQKLRDLGWEALMHPPYSPDLAPSDYRLFQSLKNSLNGVELASKEACENHLVQFFAQKS